MESNLMVIAVDNEQDLAAYVGPIYSYYEFWQPVHDRLTDPQWQRQIESGSQPARPAWTQSFRAPLHRREREDQVRLHRGPDGSAVLEIQRADGSGEGGMVTINEPLFRRLGGYATLHSLDLSNLPIQDGWLRHLQTLPDLRSLNLSQTEITDEGLRYLRDHKYLQSLDLSGTDISDAGARELVALIHLTVLDLSGTRVSPETVRELQQTLKSTQILQEGASQR